MDAYWQAKERLFALARPARRGAEHRRRARCGAGRSAAPSAALDVWTFSTRQPARLRAATSATATAASPSRCTRRRALGGRAQRADRRLQRVNLLAVIGAPARARRRARRRGRGAAAALTPVPGRMQRVGAGATTAAAGRRRLRAHARCAGEGAARAAAARGGARRRAVVRVRLRRRARRGQAPADGRASPRAWPTTWSSPATTRAARIRRRIIAQILAGVVGHDDVRRDRGPRRGDRHAHRATRDAGDVVLIAGKGHEAYQEIAGVRAARSRTSRQAQRRAATRGGAA